MRKILYAVLGFVLLAVMSRPVLAVLALDGKTSAQWSSGTSFTATVSTSSINDVLVVGIGTFSTTTTITGVSITGTGTTGWVNRGRTAILNGGATFDSETWQGTASGILNNAVLTINLSSAPAGGSGGSASAIVWGVSGANTSSINDGNASLPATATGTATTPTVLGISTNKANDFLYGFVAQANGFATFAAGPGYTLILNSSNKTNPAAQYQVFSSTQSNISSAFGTSEGAGEGWAMVVDAITAASAKNSHGKLPLLGVGN